MLGSQAVKDLHLPTLAELVVNEFEVLLRGLATDRVVQRLAVQLDQ